MFYQTIVKKILKGGFLFLLIVSLNSCIYLVVGGVGALGGYVVSPDTVEGILADHSQTEVFNAALDIVSVMGTLEEQSSTGGILIGKVHGSKVTIMIYSLSSTSTKLTIKARRSFFPRIKVAQNIYVKVANSLEDSSK